MGITEKRLQTIAFQIDVDVFEQLWNEAKDQGVSIDEILRQAVLIWLSQRRPTEPSENDATKTSKEETKSVDKFEQALIIETIQKFNGNKDKAAKALGISTRTLYRRLENFS